MRRMLVVLLGVLAMMGLAGPALADGPSGSHEEDPVTTCTDPNDPSTCTTQDQWDNDVTCGDGEAVATPVGTAVVYGLPSGAPSSAGALEVCSDDGSVVQGRVIASGDATTQSGYIAVDGDKDNQPTQAQGFARVGGSAAGLTVQCGDDAGAKDSTHPGATDGQEDCG